MYVRKGFFFILIFSYKTYVLDIFRIASYKYPQYMFVEVFKSSIFLKKDIFLSKKG